MNKFFKENLLFLVFFLIFLVSSLSAVTYFSSEKVFDAKISYVNDVKFPYYVVLDLNKKVPKNLNLDIEILYSKKNIVVGSKTQSCNFENCEIKVPINDVFFDKHKIIIRSKYNNRFYEKKLYFNLENKQKDFEFLFKKNYFYKNSASINISTLVNVFSNKNEKFQVEIIPKNLPENKEVFSFNCSNTCEQNFELKNNIIFGKYIVRIYSQITNLEKSFNIFLDNKLISKNNNLDSNIFSNKSSNFFFEGSSYKKNEKFYENYDERDDKMQIVLSNYSKFSDIEIETEDILGNKEIKKIKFFSGTLKLDSGIKNIKFLSNNSNLKNVKLEITPRLNVYSDFEDLKLEIDKKNSFLILSGKNITNESVEFSGKKYSSFSKFLREKKSTKEIKPGMGRVIRKLSDGTISTTYFAYGLISINTKKPLYHKNELVDLYLVVLDKNGYLYPNANLSLDVLDKNIIYSYTRKEISETIKKGLYHLAIPANNIGKYNLIGKVNVDGIDLVVNSYFNVVENYPYDIIRRVPFTIDPWQGPFENEFTIISYNSSKVFDFYEEIPKQFKILRTNGAKIIQTNNSQILKWGDVNTNFKPWYKANSPLKSPDLYELGKSWIEYKVKNKITKTFYENRSWLFAIDPATTFEYGKVKKQKKTFYTIGSNDFYGGCPLGNPSIPSHGVGTMNTSLTPTAAFDYVEEITRGGGCISGLNYNLTFNFSKDFIISGDIQALIYIEPEPGKAGGRDDIQVDLYDSNNNIIASKLRQSITGDGNGVPTEELFTLTPSSNTIISGNALRLKITSMRKKSNIHYGGIYPSRLEIYTKTHVSVDDIILKNSTNETVIYKTGNQLNIFANVSDALIMNDVSRVNATILYPNGSIRNDIKMSINLTNSTWNYYNFSTNILALDPVGAYTVKIKAFEGNVTHTSRAYFSKLKSSGNGVSIVPSRIEFANPGTTVDLVHYIFNLDPINSHSYSLISNSSYQVTFFEDNGVTTLKDNDGDEIIDSGTIAAGQFKKIVARVTVPNDAFINSKKLVQIISTPAAKNYYGIENFESFTVETDPTNWFDTRQNFSLIQDETLFKVKSIGLNKAIGTILTQDNIHSHYNGTNSLNFKNYEITGRFYYSDSNSSLGITFLSDYPNSNKYYSLRADKINNSNYGDGTANQFNIFSNNGGTLVGDFNSNQNAVNNSWYKFRIKVNDTGTITSIKAKIWKETSSEFPFWQIDTNATGGNRLIKGTIGIWSKGIGQKYLDDVRIANITIDSSIKDNVKDYIITQSNIKEQKQLYPHMLIGGITNLNSTLILPNSFCIAGKKLSDCSKNGPPPTIPILQYLGVVSFNKTPGFFQDFYLNGSISIPILLLPEAGKNGGKDTINLKLYAGKTLIGSDSHVDVGNGAGLTPFIETFNINPIIDYIPKNQNLSLQFSTRKYTYFYFDNSSLKSYINFPTLTYISVSDIFAQNTTNFIKEIFDVNETMVFKINITDPIGVNAINSTNVSLKYPNGTYAYFGVSPTIESNGSFWKYYNYTFTNTTEPGAYTLEVSTQEDNGVISTATISKTVLSNVPAVSITPNRLGSTVDGTSKTYLHTVTNANGVDYDIIELNTTSSISTVTLYQSDGITALTDTDGDGLVDLGYVAPGDNVNIIANIFIPTGTPVDTIDYANITAISNTNSNKTSIITDTTTVLLGTPENKQLYFHQNIALKDLSNVTPSSNLSLAKFFCIEGRAGKCPGASIGPSISFPMQTNFSRNFKFTSDLKVKVWLFPDPAGCPGGDDSYRVDIHTRSGILVGSASKSKVLTVDSLCLSPQLETFTINPLITTINKNDGLNITISSTRRDSYIYFDNSSFDSMVEMETSTFINTKSVDIFNSTNGLQNQYLYNTSYNITFKTNVTDPFGAYDIKNVTISIISPNGSYIMQDSNLTLESNSTSWKYFNLTHQFLADNEIGTYQVKISSLESNGVVSNSSNSFIFLSNGPEVKITPDGLLDAAANTTVEFTHTVTNAYVSATDVADITYNISNGNVSFTDIAGSPLTDTDSDGIIDTGTLSASGGAKLIKAIVEIPANLNPNDIITLNIIVNSSLNSSRSDFATDTINIVNNVPELKTLYLHNSIIPGIMNTSKILGAGSFVTIDQAGVPSFSWTQSPSFFKIFDHSGTYNIKVFLDSSAGGGGQSDIKAELKTSTGTILGTSIKNRIGTSGVQLVLFSIIPSIDTIPKGENLTLTLTELGRGPFDLYVDSTTYPSRIEVNTFTYISVDSISIFNSTLFPKTLFEKNATVILKMNVSDPFTVTDIVQTNLTLTYPNGSIYLNNVNLSLDQNGSDWKSYNYTITNLNTSAKGIHNIQLKALELNGVIDSASTSFTIDYTAPIISNIFATPTFLTVNDSTKISANVVDDLKIKNVTVYITHKNGSIMVVQMNNSIGNTYDYTYNLTTEKGTYSYYINTTDTSDNIRISSTFTFKVVGPRAVIGIEQIGNYFKPGEDLNLKIPIAYQSFDKEPSLIGLNVSQNKTDNFTTSIIYGDNGGFNYNKLSDIGIIVQIENYNSTLSVNNLSNLPDLEISFYNGSSYTNPNFCDLNLEYNLAGNYAYNCSIYILDEKIKSAWAKDVNNRNVSIRAINLDNNASIYDYINYSNVFFIWDVPSNVRNYGFNPLDYNISLKILDNSSGILVDIATILNQNVFIVAGENIDLSSYWNPTNWIIPDGINLGQHFVYAALINKFSGGVLIDDFSNKVEDLNNFTMDYLKINILSPNSSINYSPGNIWYNLSLDYISYPSGGWCGYSQDGGANNTMTKVNSTYYNSVFSTNGLAEGLHNYTVYCNDSVNYISHISSNFSYYDNISPVINLVTPINNSFISLSTPFIFNVNDDSNISSCSLFIDSILKNSTTNPQKNINNSLSISGITGGNHYWNISCSDSSIGNNLGFSETRNFTIDITPPQIGFVPITDLNNSYVNRSWTFGNISINESYFNSSWLEWNTSINNSLSCNFNSGINWNCFINKSSIKNSQYLYRACANDTAGNQNCTKNRIININLTMPIINILSPIDLSVKSNLNPVLFNISLTGIYTIVDKIWFELNNNGTKYLMNNISSTNWRKYLNLSIGKYSLKFYGNDTLTNQFSSNLNNFYVSSNKKLNISKEIINTNPNSYRIKYNITNNGDYKDFVLYDLIDTNFTAYNFSLLNNGSSTINGNFNGNLLNWNLSINPLSNLIITFNINGSYDYNLENNFKYGID